MLAQAWFWGTTMMYVATVLVLVYGWHKNKKGVRTDTDGQAVFFSVLVSVRNEASNLHSLFQALENQKHRRFEAVFIDDHSTDQTVQLLAELAAKATFPCQILQLPHDKAGKKAAVTFGVAHALGGWVAATDGDCQPVPGWLGALCRHINNKPGVKLLSGPVAYLAGNSLFSRIQAVEFASLVGTGAASLALQAPNMCNGANLAYAKAAFVEVGGYVGSPPVASGDDEFLLHKFHARFPGSAAFVAEPAATVFTAASPSLQAFYRQRVRWAGKWRHYQNPAATAAAVYVFLINATFLLFTLLALAGVFPGPDFLAGTFLKISAEFVFLTGVLTLSGQTRHAWLVPFISLAYPFYAVFFALAAFKKHYRWKGRQVA